MLSAHLLKLANSIRKFANKFNLTFDNLRHNIGKTFKITTENIYKGETGSIVIYLFKILEDYHPETFEVIPKIILRKIYLPLNEDESKADTDKPREYLLLDFKIENNFLKMHLKKRTEAPYARLREENEPLDPIEFKSFDRDDLDESSSLEAFKEILQDPMIMKEVPKGTWVDIYVPSNSLTRERVIKIEEILSDPILENFQKTTQEWD